jgi:hypothetical protein
MARLKPKIQCKEILNFWVTKALPLHTFAQSHGLQKTLKNSGSADLTNAIALIRTQGSWLLWTSKVFMVSVVQVQAVKGELQGMTVQTT